MTMLCITTEPYVFLYTFVFTMHTTVLPQLVLEKSCHQKYNMTVCRNIDQKKFQHEQNEVHRDASVWMLVLLSCALLPSLITVLIWGPFADIIGRKRAIVVPPVLLGMQCLAYFLNSHYVVASPLYLIPGAFITSLYGEFQGAYAIAYSYMADVTDKSSIRNLRMAIIEGIMFFSGAPAGLVGGFLLQKFGYQPVFITTACLCVVMFINVLYFLPSPLSNVHSSDNPKTSSKTSSVSDESVPENDEELPIMSGRDQHNKYQVIKDNLNPLMHLRKVMKVIFDRRSMKVLLPLLLAFGFCVLSLTGELYVTVLYIKHNPFNLTPEEIGYYNAFISVVRGLGAIILTQVIIRCCRLKDYMLIIIGLISQITNYFLLGLSSSKIMLYIISVSGLGIGVGTSSIRATISKQVPTDSHGTALAAIEFMDVLAAFLGNIISNSIYLYTVSSYPGTAFFVLGSVVIISLLITSITWCSCRVIVTDTQEVSGSD